MIKYLICCIVFITVAAGQKQKRQAGYGLSGSGGASVGGGMSSYQSSSSSYGSGGGLGGGLSSGFGGINGGVGGGFSSSDSFSQYGAAVAVPAQNPYVFSALDQLRGNEALSATDVQNLIATSIPGTSYPILSFIPQTTFSCSSVRQFGFYADPETRCQVFRRCEANNFMFSYICPNGTLFNQITLVCDWWYNVNCANAPAWVDYSNPRIYRQDLRLFDDPLGFNLGLGGSGSASGIGFSGSSANGLGLGAVSSGGFNSGSGGAVAGSSGSYGGSSNQYGVSGGGSFGGSGISGGGGYSQGSSGPLYRSSASTTNQLVLDPPAVASEKSLRRNVSSVGRGGNRIKGTEKEERVLAPQL